ncbi:VOC family protein [Caulobacter zeae]|uniref:VOC family protein n=1 Tax=Caulobacter zeae TaxID=2055137 RepID=A0A2N5DFS2_9CAUL|nr:VOC family protein [Caulobacter zeae]PLR24918.1 VOC family protein [Caulobacter zeae]
MQMHRGRMIDHIQLRTQDLAAMRRFYTAVLEVIGVPVVDGGEYFYADEMWVDVGEPATHIHLAFQAKDRETVQRFHEAGLAAGGRDNGGPGEREYHPGYYAAFLLDPDGNNIEAVYHGPHERSVESVVLTWDE